MSEAIEHKAIGLRAESRGLPGFARLLNPAPAWNRWGWSLFGAWSIGLVVLGIWAGQYIGYSRGISEHPSTVIGNRIADEYAKALEAK